MRKLLVCLLIAALAVIGTAFAETTEIENYAIAQIDAAGTAIDVDGDGTPDNVSMAQNITDDSETYTLIVNDMSIDGEGWGLMGELYIMNVDNVVYMLVGENGMSDDPCNYIYTVIDGKIVYCGSVPAAADSIIPVKGGFTATIRGNLIQTWYREADFIFTSGGYYDETIEDFVTPTPTIVEVPRYLYAMGTKVTLNKDIVLQKSQYDSETATTIAAGKSAVLVATDDFEWVYVQKIYDEGDEYEDYTSGWLRVKGMYEIEAEGEMVPAWELFQGLFLAD